MRRDPRPEPHRPRRLRTARPRRYRAAPLRLLDGWLYGRTSHGAKLSIIPHNHWVAFEVDEVAGLLDWRSVIVRGGWYSYDTAPPSEQEVWDRGVAALQELLPGTLTPNDPVPFRTVVFRIHTAEITGRECRPAPAHN
jgi:nitroimidazol reductase NimA-like FMN-containing flavoprotein (pyridoxamine 5'-phosphate oxidase superfamily)